MRDNCVKHADDQYDDLKREAKYEALNIAITAMGRSVPPRWISVKDRLPDTRDWVLVIGEFVPEGGWFVPQIAEYFLDSWRLDVDECSSPEDRGIRVTHWMPLPEPPKEPEA